MFNEADAPNDQLVIFNKPRPSTGGMGTDYMSGPDDGNASPGGARQVKDAALDSQKMQELHSRLWGFFLYELDRQADNRAQQALDDDFYDNNQWTDEERRILEDRGQIPLVYNVISTTVNWMIGTERRGRTEFRVLPRRADGSRAAELKTQFMKYIADVNNSEFASSVAFQEAVKVGIGWLESGVQSTIDSEPVFDRAETWRNMLWDSASVEYDISDARYLMRHKWVDQDIAIAMKASRKDVVRAGSSENIDGFDDLGDEFMDSQEDYYALGGGSGRSAENYVAVSRPRVRLVEVWFTLPTETMRLRGGEFAGEIFDKYSPAHVEEVQSGNAELFTSVMMRMHVALMTADGFIHVSESPYRHNRFPFTPIWCYRRAKDRLPYGIIRGLRDIQTDVNKRASKALHILSTNKTIMDKGAVDDLDKFEEEASRPDAIIVKNPGKELTMNADRDLAAGHLELMSRDISMIQQASGVTDESLGRTTNAVSGKAITARQDQGALATAAIFDNYRLSRKLHGEKMLSIIEQFASEEKQFRITNARGTPTYVTINDGLPENDIVRTKADFVITEDTWRASNRQSQVSQFLDTIGTLQLPPEIVLPIIDLIVESTDIPNRDEIVARIRKITGQKDPDADPNEPPSAEDQAKAEIAKKQAELQVRGAEAEIADKEASAAERQARARKAAADVERVTAQTTTDRVATIKQALEAALAAISVPGAADAGDSILESAGFKGPDLPTPTAAASVAPETRLSISN